MPKLHIIAEMKGMQESFVIEAPTYMDELKQLIPAKIRKERLFSGRKIVPFTCLATPLKDDDYEKLLLAQSRIISLIRYRARQLN
jgi:hypothetical protein